MTLLKYCLNLIIHPNKLLSLWFRVASFGFRFLLFSRHGKLLQMAWFAAYCLAILNVSVESNRKSRLQRCVLVCFAASTITRILKTCKSCIFLELMKFCIQGSRLWVFHKYFTVAFRATFIISSTPQDSQKRTQYSQLTDQVLVLVVVLSLALSL